MTGTRLAVTWTPPAVTRWPGGACFGKPYLPPSKARWLLQEKPWSLAACPESLHTVCLKVSEYHTGTHQTLRAPVHAYFAIYIYTPSD